VKIKEILLFTLILLAAFFLRVWQYYDFPIGGETADESAWTLLGASLIQERVPTSWSYFLPYENYHYVEGVFYAPMEKGGLQVVCLPQLYVDLYHYERRGREQAEYLKREAMGL